MLKVLILLLFMLNLLSCHQEAVFTKGKYGASTLEDKKLKLTETEVIDWKVGPGFKQKVSKGFQIVFNLPVLSMDDARTLYENYTINGWVIRVIKDGRKGRRTLGYMYYPIKHKKEGRMSFGGQQIKSGAVRIFYAAASMSNRFQNFQCPAFEHNLSIEDIRLNEVKGPTPRFLISGAEEKKIYGKVEKFSLSPTIFNGEMNLSGSYFIELALYNVEKQLRKSNFVIIPGSVDVRREEQHVIRGCQGATVPPREEEAPRGKFHFGR